jgi:hypothetical protein
LKKKKTAGTSPRRKREPYKHIVPIGFSLVYVDRSMGDYMEWTEKSEPPGDIVGLLAPDTGEVLYLETSPTTGEADIVPFSRIEFEKDLIEWFCTSHETSGDKDV